MGARRHAATLSVVFAPLLAIAPACRDATVVRVYFASDLPCAALKGLALTFASTASEAEANDPSVRSDACSPDGSIGDLALVPEEENDGALAIKAVLGVDRDVDQCRRASSYEGCIVARRRIAYLPHRELRLRITMHDPCKVTCDAARACVNACDADTTCVLPGATCVSSQEDPAQCDSEQGCDIDKEHRATSDASADAISSLDATSSSDATSDAVTDARAGDDGSTEANDSGSDGGILSSCSGAPARRPKTSSDLRREIRKLRNLPPPPFTRSNAPADAVENARLSRSTRLGRSKGKTGVALPRGLEPLFSP